MAGHKPDDVIWTKELDDLLVELAGEYSYTQTAAAMGLSRNQVAGRLNRIGFKKSSKPPAKANKRPPAPRPVVRPVVKPSNRVAATEQRSEPVDAEPAVPVTEHEASPAPTDADYDGPVSLMELDDYRCPWPVDEGFCGRGKGRLDIYCADHHSDSVNPRQPPNKTKRTRWT